MLSGDCAEQRGENPRSRGGTKQAHSLSQWAGSPTSSPTSQSVRWPEFQAPQLGLLLGNQARCTLSEWCQTPPCFLPISVHPACRFLQMGARNVTIGQTAELLKGPDPFATSPGGPRGEGAQLLSGLSSFAASFLTIFWCPPNSCLVPTTAPFASGIPRLANASESSWVTRAPSAGLQVR